MSATARLAAGRGSTACFGRRTGPAAVNNGKYAIADTEFTLWLTPREPLRSELRSIIRHLAERLDAVAFEPHVTLFCGASSEAAAAAVARRLARRRPPVELTADRLDHTDAYAKTLFVQFQDSVVARRMFEMAREYSPQSNYALNPHLSLLYKKLPESERRELCRTAAAPMGFYCFDRLRLVETELPIEDDGPVRRWRVVCDEPLAPG